VKTVQHKGQALAYIEVTRADIELANAIAHDVLGRTLDELPPQTRRLLQLIRAMVLAQAARSGLRPADVRFTRRDVREATQWSDNQLKVHCARLAEMEYLHVHGGSRGHSLRYELRWDGSSDEDNARRLCGLIDLEDLAEFDADDSSPRLRLAQVGVGAPQVGGVGAQVGVKLAPSCPQVGAKLDSVKQVPSRAGAGLQPDAVLNGEKVHIKAVVTSASAAVVHVAKPAAH